MYFKHVLGPNLLLGRSSFSANLLIGGPLNPSEGCFSDVRGPKIPNNLKQMVRTKIVHTSGTFLEHFRKNRKHFVFRLCSHIQSNTQNPNPIFNITIYGTKCTNNAKTHSIFWKISNNFKNIKLYFVIYIISIIHILYLLYFL